MTILITGTFNWHRLAIMNTIPHRKMQNVINNVIMINHTVPNQTKAKLYPHVRNYRGP